MIMVGKRIWMYVGLVALVSCLLAGSANAGLFGFGKSKKKPTQAQAFVVGAVVVFPFDQEGIAKVPDTLGADVAAALRSSLVGIPKCSVYMYRDKLAPIARAKSDQELKANEETGPFGEDKAKALKLAKLLEADYYLVGAIEDYQADATAKTAQITVSVELVNARSGKLVKTLLVTGRTPDDAVRSELDEATALAAGELVAKVKTQLIEEQKEPEQAAPATEPAK